jgi:hypothetical protein
MFIQIFTPKNNIYEQQILICVKFNKKPQPCIPSTFELLPMELLLIAELFVPNNGRAQFIYCLLVRAETSISFLSFSLLDFCLFYLSFSKNWLNIANKKLSQSDSNKSLQIKWEVIYIHYSVFRPSYFRPWVLCHSNVPNFFNSLLVPFHGYSGELVKYILQLFLLNHYHQTRQTHSQFDVS